MAVRCALAVLAASAAAQLCKDQGCIPVFRSGARCQCFPGCDRYEDCCSDFSTECFDSAGQFRTTVVVEGGFESKTETTSRPPRPPRPQHRKPVVHSSPFHSESCATRGCSSDFEPERPCQCNADCTLHDSCCHDFAESCGTTSAESTETRSCRAYGCGELYVKGQNCQCNPSCKRHDDCCPDYRTVCPGQASGGSCKSYGCRELYVDGQTCQCNPSCTQHDDCCADYRSVCPHQASSGSCKSYGCGAFDQAQSCQCNEACLDHGSCCSDYRATCAATGTGVEATGASSGSVKASCAAYGCVPFDAHNDCQCDSECLRHKNCCPDFAAHCSSRPIRAPQHGPGSCAELGCDSFSPAAMCQCNDECARRGDCCADYEATCHLPKEPLGSCAIFGCIGFRQGNDCQCDPSCQKHGNCCSDYSAYCSMHAEKLHGTILQ
ncbi:PRG4 [Symbiodinium sp. CCMP2456]|nr:PRG4 [Symbiodinium sp. CCMP2456]